MSERIWLVNPKRRRKVGKTPAAVAREFKRLEKSFSRKTILKRESPQKRKGRTVAKRRKSKKKWGSPAQRAAFRKMIAARKGGAASPRRKKRVRSAHHKGGSVAKRRRKARRGPKLRSVRRKGGGSVSRASWRSSGFRRNPRRRHYRRNPGGFSVASITNRLKQGVIDAGLVLGGKAGARFIGNFAPAQFKDTPIKIAAVQAIAALGLGIVGARFLGGDKARFLLAGGISGAGESLLKNLDATKGNIGLLLGDDDLALGDGEGDYAGNSLNAYEAAANAGIGAYQTY